MNEPEQMTLLKTLKRKVVAMKAAELSDLYALRTLYDYVSARQKQYHFKFSEVRDLLKFEEVAAGADILRAPLTPKAKVITVHSDIARREKYASRLDIDASILKNAVFPLSQDEKQSLRQKWSALIPLDKPILVYSYPTEEASDLRFLHTVKDLAQVLVLGYEPAEELYGRDAEYRVGNKRGLKPLYEYPITVINSRGVLKKAYALADAAVNGSNLMRSHYHMHNFVEATEGGPLFMVPPGREYRKQFGYTELSRAGVIRNCTGNEALLEAVTHYLRNFDNKRAHCEKREKHLEATRDLYLPILAQYINHAFNGAPAPDETDPDNIDPILEIVRLNDALHSLVHIKHRRTDWGRSIIW